MPDTDPAARGSRRRERTRTQVLDACEQLLSERAAEEIRVEDVAARAGISAASVYVHFGTKDGLLAAVTERVLDTASLMIPDLRERMVFCEASTPMTQERFTLTSDGSCYGIAPLLKNLGPFRPKVTTHIPGLFLGGASTEHMVGINATIWGGMKTAGTILGRDLEQEVKDGAVFVDESRLTEITDVWDPLLASKPGSTIRRAVRRRPKATA
ncbi:helix-turn-helix domain-containing protein [Nocardioides daphniae]|uniref:TetR family transcriptional regulator n=1 Tax=Nocardioides daphniae TaxID=402297 RepID=A0A4P7U901_9ACTN|nr:helix-turn-helix domain-containing protein [Nocardioides daphniae]QCC76643.1 TetR family transcriptional regulator [Nocardioides daphniae]GGD15003.1 hypothetical protein GCM10007231_12440 [Nocardioides daphniae]